MDIVNFPAQPPTTMSIVSASLINAYTVEADQLDKMKVSYVNFYSEANSANDGAIVPVLMRVGGFIKSAEMGGLLNLDKIAVFFDLAAEFYFFENADIANFNYACSQNNLCQAYKKSAAAGGLLDAWPLSNAVIIDVSQMNLQNEFDIIVPISAKPNILPTHLYVGFLNYLKVNNVAT